MKFGIENKLNLKNSLNLVQNESLPTNLYHALLNFQSNKFMKSFLGDDLHQHFTAFFNLEYTEFMNQVDEWELNRYLYNI
jgi:glutamine synthetase